MQPGDPPSPFANFTCVRPTFHQRPSNLRTDGKHSVNFHQLSVLPRHLPSTTINFPGILPSTSVKFPCSQGHSINFREPSVQPGDFPSTFVNIACGREASCQHSVWPGVFPSISDNVLCCREISVNNHLLSMRLGELLSTSIKYPWHQETFLLFLLAFREARRSSVNIHLLFVSPGDLPSTSIHFFSSERTSIHFRQLSMRP